MDLREKILALPAEEFTLDGVTIRPIKEKEDLWYATVECELAPGQLDYVNPAGFSIGLAWMDPAHHVPCVICLADGTRVGYILLRTWAPDEAVLSWSFYLDRRRQGKGYGRKAAQLAVRLLKAAGHGAPIKLAVEESNLRGQALYRSIGFERLDELDGDDLVFGI